MGKNFKASSEFIISLFNIKIMKLFLVILLIVAALCLGYYVYCKLVVSVKEPKALIGCQDSFEIWDFSVKLKQNLKYFSGYINPLYRVLSEDNIIYADKIFNGLSKILRLNCPEFYKEWSRIFENDRSGWNETLYKSKTKELFKSLKFLGLKKSDETFDKWSNDKFEYYQVESDIEEGQSYEVIAPYWMYDGEVFERGLVRPK